MRQHVVLATPVLLLCLLSCVSARPGIRRVHLRPTPQEVFPLPYGAVIVEPPVRSSVEAVPAAASLLQPDAVVPEPPITTAPGVELPPSATGTSGLVTPATS